MQLGSLVFIILFLASISDDGSLSKLLLTNHQMLMDWKMEIRVFRIHKW